MKHAVTAIILTLILPALCFGHTPSNPHLGPAVLETAGWEGYRLDIGPLVQDGFSFRLKSDFAPAIEDQHPLSRSLRTVPACLHVEAHSAPEDMVSMMSFLWAEMFGGFDIVAEAKEFAWQIRSRRSRPRTNSGSKTDRRFRWNLVIACCLNDQMELAARFNNRGHLFGEDNMSLQVKAVGSGISDVGLIMSYADGGLSVMADSVSLADAAKVKLVVKF